MTITYDKQVLIKRGNTTEASTYVGPLGELVLDTDTNLVYVHDGVTVGGITVSGEAAVEIQALESNVTILQSNVSVLESAGYVTETYVDNAIANVEVLISNYGNSNVAAYLPTYSGNIALDNITFSDLSEQRTAYTGQQWRTNLTSTLLSKPSWMSYYPDGSKPTLDTNFGFDSGGMWFAGNADSQHAYPIRTNVHFFETDAVEITATFEFDNIGDDHGLAIFLAETTQPYWRFTTDLSRIAFQYSVATPEIRGRTTSSVAGAPVLSIGNTYTIKFIYDPLAESNNITVYTYEGADTSGTLLDTRTISETLPAGDYVIGFDADQDQNEIKSYYTNLTVKTLTNAVFNELEIVNNLTVGTLTFPDDTVQSTAWTGFTANAANWSNPAPTTLDEAIDRLAVLLKTLNSGTGA